MKIHHQRIMVMVWLLLGSFMVVRADDKSKNIQEVSGVVSKRAVPAGFFGMRGKKLYDYTLQEAPEPWDGVYANELDYDKRTPLGFFGMRGKKDDEKFGFDKKRIPQGFFGMRGKKDFDDLPDPKRTFRGFVGMRGKKSFDPQEELNFVQEEKRTPVGFFGMRGKKHPRLNGFFGMRGKKFPYEFRGKFVGVRGKKMSNEVTGPDFYTPEDLPLNLNQLGQDLDLNQLMLLLTEQNDNAWMESDNQD